MEKIKAKWAAVKAWASANPGKSIAASFAVGFMLALILS
jgi:hypothetical protein